MLSQALGHPIRRQILRVLHEQEAAPTLRRLTELIPASANSLNYQTLVLEQCCCISVGGTSAERAGRRLESRVVDNEVVRGVLVAMREVDAR